MDGDVLDGCGPIAEGIYLEGLAVDARRGVIWYSDVIGGGIHGITPDGTKVATFNAERMWTGGVLVNDDGAILSSGQGGIMWNHPDSGRSGWLISALDGAPVNGINEMAPDGRGGIFFGTIDVESVIAGTQPGSTALYHLSADRRVTQVQTEIGFSNGLMFDPGRRRLYCNDTFSGVWAFDVDGDFRLSGRQRLLDKEDADGMALDETGTLWITGFRSDFFTRVSAAGERLADVPAGAGSITQLRFAGDDMRDCYFNSVPADGGDTLKEGGALTRSNSRLYRGRSGIAGLRLPLPGFQL